LVPVLALCYAVIGCTQKTGNFCNMENNIAKIREELRPLDFSGRQSYSDSVVSYFQCYGLDFAGENVEHVFGTFKSDGRTLSGHVFKPKKYKATVFVLHGYLNHCAQLKHLIRYLIEAGYAVAAFDLPGHGLSSGERAAIEDFSQYSDALAGFVSAADKGLAGPYHVIGFSTGASAVIDYLFSCENSVFDKVILAAPLVHSVAWQSSKAGLKFYGSFASHVPRIYRKESSDEQYLKFVRADPLQSTDVSLKWVKALHRWNDRIADLPACKAKVKVVQGTSDKTVDWKFNVEFIREKFSDVDVSLIENCRHEMFNESEDIRKKVFSQISGWL